MDLDTARHGLVTGGASGIGLGIARAMARRGMAVTIVDINAEALDAACADEPGFAGVVLDTRDREGWQRMKQAVEAERGPVDILVNNAGIAQDGRGFAEMDPASFDRILAINLGGVANGVFTFAGDMKRRGRGHIVNTSSQAGLTVDYPGVGGYAVAKFGVTALTESLRDELAPHGVGVSLLCPGFIRTNIAANTRRAGGTMLPYDGAVPPDTIGIDDVGVMVLDSIAADDLYIITHPDVWQAIERRMNRIHSACMARLGD